MNPIGVSETRKESSIEIEFSRSLDKSLIVHRFEAFQHANKNDVFIYRWDNIVLDTYDGGERSVSLCMPLMKNIGTKNRFRPRLQMVESSTKAFLVSDDRMLNELDLRDLTIDSPGEVGSHIDEYDDSDLYGHRQVSTDGHHVGFFYRFIDESDPSKKEAVVQITDLTRPENSAKYVKLVEPTPDPRNPWTSSADLSLLYTTEGIYDLSSSNTNTTTTRLHHPDWDSWHCHTVWDAQDHVIFSSCNCFVFLFLPNVGSFKILKICRGTKSLIELHVRGPASLLSGRSSGAFHPNLPIFLLGPPRNYVYERHLPCPLVQIHLSTLETAELPPSTEFSTMLFR